MPYASHIRGNTQRSTNVKWKNFHHREHCSYASNQRDYKSTADLLWKKYQFPINPIINGSLTSPLLMADLPTSSFVDHILQRLSDYLSMFPRFHSQFEIPPPDLRRSAGNSRAKSDDAHFTCPRTGSQWCYELHGLLETSSGLSLVASASCRIED